MLLKRLFTLLAFTTALGRPRVDPPSPTATAVPPIPGYETPVSSLHGIRSTPVPPHFAKMHQASVHESFGCFSLCAPPAPCTDTVPVVASSHAHILTGPLPVLHVFLAISALLALALVKNYSVTFVYEQNLPNHRKFAFYFGPARSTALGSQSHSIDADAYGRRRGGFVENISAFRDDLSENTGQSDTLYNQDGTPVTDDNAPALSFETEASDPVPTSFASVDVPITDGGESSPRQLVLSGIAPGPIPDVSPARTSTGTVTPDNSMAPSTSDDSISLGLSTMESDFDNLLSTPAPFGVEIESSPIASLSSNESLTLTHGDGDSGFDSILGTPVPVGFESPSVSTASWTTNSSASVSTLAGAPDSPSYFDLMSVPAPADILDGGSVASWSPASSRSASDGLSAHGNSPIPLFDVSRHPDELDALLSSALPDDDDDFDDLFRPLPETRSTEVVIVTTSDNYPSIALTLENAEKGIMETLEFAGLQTRLGSPYHTWSSSSHPVTPVFSHGGVLTPKPARKAVQWNSPLEYIRYISPRPGKKQALMSRSLLFSPSSGPAGHRSGVESSPLAGPSLLGFLAPAPKLTKVVQGEDKENVRFTAPTPPRPRQNGGSQVPQFRTPMSPLAAISRVRNGYLQDVAQTPTRSRRPNKPGKSMLSIEVDPWDDDVY